MSTGKIKAVLVTGSREMASEEEWLAIQERLHNEAPTLVIHGGASGADYIAKRFCQDGNADELEVPACWKALGKKAGPIRNQAMVDIAAALVRAGHVATVLAFPRGSSIGTRDCIRRAEAAGLTVRVHELAIQEAT
jgi:hypothetical protein